MNTLSTVNAPSTTSSSRRVWVYLLVAVVLGSLILLAWQKGFFLKDGSKELTAEEEARINAFLDSANMPVPTTEEVESIKAYLNQPTPTPSAAEQEEIFKYLNQ